MARIHCGHTCDSSSLQELGRILDTPYICVAFPVEEKIFNQEILKESIFKDHLSFAGKLKEKGC